LALELGCSDSSEILHGCNNDIQVLVGELGLLAMPYSEEWGGGGLPYEVYLQVLEEIGQLDDLLAGVAADAAGALPGDASQNGDPREVR